MSLAAQVVRRFLAEAIADPKHELGMFQRAIDLLATKEEWSTKYLAMLHAWKEATHKEDSTTARSIMDKIEEHDDGSRWSVESMMKGGYWFLNNQSTCKQLFWSILQQYRLPPNLQRSIEAASKFWSKNGVRPPRPPTSTGPSPSQVDYIIANIEAYHKMLAELRKQAMNAEAAIAKGQAHADPTVAAETKIHVGPFDVVNTGGFDAERMKKVVEVVEKAEKALTSHGLGKVCYGDILVSKSISGKRVGAFYLGSSDEMFVRADILDDETTVRVVCHELAHRLQRKFLEHKTGEIENIYEKLKNEDTEQNKLPAAVYPAIGDVAEIPQYGPLGKLKKWKVFQINKRKREIQVVEEDSYKAWKENWDTPLVRWNIPVETWWKAKGKELEAPAKPTPTLGKFVTRYAGTDSSENFAEMVSFYVLDKLPKPQVELLEPVLFS